MFKEFGPEKCCWLKLWLVLLIPFRIFIPEKIDLKNVKCMLRTYIPSSEPPIYALLLQNLLTTFKSTTRNTKLANLMVPIFYSNNSRNFKMSSSHLR